MNERIQITKQSTITFKRIDTKACTHYQIYARGENIPEYLLDTIENPKTPSPYNRIKFLEYNKNKIWEFDEKVMAKTSSDVAVYVNNIRLNTGQYTFSSSLSTLNIHINLKPKDSIKVEYKVDRLEYVHNTNKKHEYRVVPIFRNDYRLGDHSYLKY